MKKAVLILALILSPIIISKIFSQPPPPPSGPLCWPPPCAIPLDGGVSILIAAGIAYGGKKIYDNSKKNPL